MAAAARTAPPAVLAGRGGERRAEEDDEDAAAFLEDDEATPLPSSPLPSSLLAPDRSAAIAALAGPEGLTWAGTFLPEGGRTGLPTTAAERRPGVRGAARAREKEEEEEEEAAGAVASSLPALPAPASSRSEEPARPLRARLVGLPRKSAAGPSLSDSMLLSGSSSALTLALEAAERFPPDICTSDDDRGEEKEADEDDDDEEAAALRPAEDGALSLRPPPLVGMTAMSSSCVAAARAAAAFPRLALGGGVRSAEAGARLLAAEDGEDRADDEGEPSEKEASLLLDGITTPGISTPRL